MKRYGGIFLSKLVGKRLISTKVLGISSSPRAKGNSDAMLNEILRGVRAAGDSIETETVYLRDYHLSKCIGCENCRKDKICTGVLDGMQILYPKVETSKGMVLVSPTHNYNITTDMKTFIDRLYCYYDFDTNVPRGWSSRLAGQDRVAGVAAVCEQLDPDDMGWTIPAMSMPLEAYGYEVVGEVEALCVFHKGRVKRQEDVMEKCWELGLEIGKSVIE